MRIAAKHPKDFGKLFAALVPQPTGRLRRSCWEARHQVGSATSVAGELRVAVRMYGDTDRRIETTRMQGRVAISAHCALLYCQQ